MKVRNALTRERLTRIRMKAILLLGVAVSESLQSYMEITMIGVSINKGVWFGYGGHKMALI
jgi:hypothetical protein